MQPQQSQEWGSSLQPPGDQRAQSNYLTQENDDTLQIKENSNSEMVEFDFDCRTDLDGNIQSNADFFGGPSYENDQQTIRHNMSVEHTDGQTAQLSPPPGQSFTPKTARMRMTSHVEEKLCTPLRQSAPSFNFHSPTHSTNQPMRQGFTPTQSDKSFTLQQQKEAANSELYPHEVGTSQQNLRQKHHLSTNDKQRPQMASSNWSSPVRRDRELTDQSSPKAQARFCERAIPLITMVEQADSDMSEEGVRRENTFEVNPEAEAIIRQIKGPIGVVAVAGMYRTGKSYFLNRVLLNRQKGFGVGPSINPCTKGIWMWGTPLSGFSNTGEPLSVIVIDSEGIGGLDEDNNHDMRIFSLALLLSSFFIYNSLGQIDENALNNLSLVVNLTKHIQTSGGESIDQYMPAFMWIIRDFTLQLLDENGIVITAAEYLEKALEFKGANMSEPKNEIRQALTKFFPRRDCSTMIRPVVEEEQLQNLDSMELGDFRPEFIEQMMSLRHRIMHKMQVKRIHGRPMDGSTWIDLIKSYVSTINDGGVPNIENSWTMICREKSKYRMAQCFAAWDRELAQLQIPNNEADCERNLEDLRNSILNDFHKDLGVDDHIIAEYVANIQTSLTDRIAEIKIRNYQACQECAQNMLQQLFGELDQIQKTFEVDQNELQTEQFFAQIEFALREMSIFYTQNCYDFPEKSLFLAEAKSQYLLDFLGNQSRAMINQRRFHSELEEQLKQKLGSQMREAYEEAHSEKIKLEGQYKCAQLSKSELEATNTVLREQVAQLKELHMRDCDEHNNELGKLRDGRNEETFKSRTAQEQFDEQTKDLQRTVKKQASEFDKEKALLEQKIEFLEKSLSEKTERERDSSLLYATEKSSLSAEIKTVCSKYEGELKILQNQLEEERERASDNEIKLAERDASLTEFRQKMIEMESTLKGQLADANAQVKELQGATSQLKTESGATQTLTFKLKQRETDLERAQKALEQSEANLKVSVEARQLTQHDSLKTIAVRDQKIEFLTMQLAEAKEQLEDVQRQHATMVKALHQNTGDMDQESNSAHSEKLDQMQKQFQSTAENQLALIKTLQLQNEELQQKLNESDLAAKLAQNELNRVTAEARLAGEEIDKTKVSLLERVKLLETQRQKQASEGEETVNAITQRLEKELREKDEQLSKEAKEVSSRSEEQMAQMKNFYEIEKEKVELRVNEEKERANKRLKQAQDDIEGRFVEQSREKDMEIEVLNAQIRELDQQQQNYVAQVDHEMMMKQQICDTLERQVTDQKDRLNQIETQRNNAFERQIESFESQRQELNSKIDRLMQEVLDKDKNLASIEHRSERDQQVFERKQNEFELNKQHLERERDQVQEKLEGSKGKLSEVQDELMHHRLESGREQALQTQQIEFQNRKISELQMTLDEGQRQFELKLKSYRQEIFEDAQAQIERVTSEKELWETKYEQKRKHLKEVEGSLCKSNTDLLQDNSLLQQQLKTSEREKSLMEQTFQDEVENLQGQLASSLDANEGQSQYMHGSAEDLMRLKAELQDTERELVDMQSTYDRDKALWEGKVQFLENQKDNYKRDLVESQRKFEMTLEQLQKRGSFDKGKLESSQNAMLKVIETKYKAQIKEMMDTHNAVSTESTNRARRLEQELSVVKESTEREKTQRSSEGEQLDRKLADTLEAKQKLEIELEVAINDNNRRTNQFQKQLEKEKSSFRSRLAEVEKRMKESETKRSQLRITMEKERANWRLETDQLKHLEKKQQQQQIDMEQYVATLELSKEKLRKENEKIKAEMKNMQGQNVSNGPSPVPPRKQFTAFTHQVNSGSTASLPTNNQNIVVGNRYFNSNPAERIAQPSNNGSTTNNNALNSSMSQSSQNGSTAGGAGNAVAAAISRLKENQQQAYAKKVKRQGSPSPHGSLNHSQSNFTENFNIAKVGSKPPLQHYQQQSASLKMMPPLPTGATLQNRYQQVMGGADSGSKVNVNEATPESNAGGQYDYR